MGCGLPSWGWGVPILFVLLFGSCSGSPDGERVDPGAGSREAAEIVGSVIVEVQFQRDSVTDLSTTVPCSNQSTVLGVLQEACRRSGREVVSRGQGETAFVTSIGGIENQRSAGDNWIFTVNGELADRSCDAFGVVPGDVVVWRFGEYSVPGDEADTNNR